MCSGTTVPPHGFGRGGALLEGTDDRPALALAPMEGISDSIVRDMLGAVGGIDVAVTEFIRVTQFPVRSRVFLREHPELRNAGCTKSGVPVLVQLLGGDPELVAESARVAVELGAIGVDLNFGCPAKKVNGHDGGAALLRCPSRVRDVVRATREAVRADVPVSAKIRMGWDDPDDVVGIAEQAEAGGAAWITIHGRTKMQMYKPSADWLSIRRAAEAVGVPVVANGDIFDRDSFERCRELTGCRAFMLGRGAFRTPNLFRWLRGQDTGAWTPDRSVALLVDFAGRVRSDPRYNDPERAALNRLKGWVRALADASAQMEPTFHLLKRATRLDDALAFLSPLAAAA